MFLYGASGHAKVIIDILLLSGVRISGLFDDNPEVRALGPFRVQQYSEIQVEKQELIIAVGRNDLRRNIAARLTCSFGKAIHPGAIVSSSSSLGEGTVVMGGAVINADVIIGKHCIINTNASVDHDVTIEDFVHISPNATLCGNVFVGESSCIGAGSIIIPGKKIGKNTVIGAGAVVVSDIPENVVAFGNPCRIVDKT